MDELNRWYGVDDPDPEKLVAKESDVVTKWPLRAFQSSTPRPHVTAR